MDPGSRKSADISPDTQLWSVGEIDFARYTRVFVQAPSCSRIIARELAAPLPQITCTRYQGSAPILGWLHGGWVPALAGGGRAEASSIHQLGVALDSEYFVVLASPYECQPGMLLAFDELPPTGLRLRYVVSLPGNLRDLHERAAVDFIRHWNPVVIASSTLASERACLTRAGCKVPAGADPESREVQLPDV